MGMAHLATRDVILIASGSKMSLIFGAEPLLQRAGLRPRLASMPAWRLFEEQPSDYRESALPSSVSTRISEEAASPLGWERWTGAEGAVLGVDEFGASAPGATVLAEYGFTVDHVVERVLTLRAAHRKRNDRARRARPSRVPVRTEVRADSHLRCQRRSR